MLKIQFLLPMSVHYKFLSMRSTKSRFLFSSKIFGSVFLYSYTLCSRNFQNVKLRLDVVGTWLFYWHSNFTWNQFLVNSYRPKISFLGILEVLNFNFSKFEQLSNPKFTKFQSLESLNLLKMTFLVRLNMPKFDFTLL